MGGKKVSRKNPRTAVLVDVKIQYLALFIAIKGGFVKMYLPVPCVQYLLPDHVCLLQAPQEVDHDLSKGLENFRKF